MTPKNGIAHDFEAECAAGGDAPRLAAAVALLEIGDQAGLLAPIESGDEFTAGSLAAAAGLPEVSVAGYLEALESADIIQPVGAGSFRAADDFDVIQHQAGFISWTMNANRPFIDNAREFLTDLDRGSGIDLRDGRKVAVSSAWMGSKAFYPAILSTMVEMKPALAVDLGAGTCRLLIEVLQNVPGVRAVGLDMDPYACREAERCADRAGVGDRLDVVERSIQSVADDPAMLAGADVIHAGYVFHDMFPTEADIAHKVLENCREALRDNGLMAITEIVPYLRNERERRFSAIVTYYHRQFMKRRPLTEEEWIGKLRAAGFSSVRAVELAFPTGRLFLATK
ncbi:class I SAM-dependent methyltransferase [Actinocrispum wychmicini]|uniref:Precorrin-6B methylase 2 n=1 Tax=Actinocrispum wychmicini TaxID=1213861 RepID=A0A4R2ILU9_9PSEU|nr:class I SAM-dependent methyltransferase [Actinocrispum wychmicini]TCO45306.1 precorrin-6B methylase 2 [Actinocrispum wychmicini]